jgi:hypothetical protein
MEIEDVAVRVARALERGQHGVDAVLHVEIRLALRAVPEDVR